ncbi:KAT8 regulatory NSL complex subunit 1-like isoform X1 [Mytilus californianus]|uniref:KAT8 regulatory NSL complex subunit 1-like isoform X1 n=1 Tax=Mytilus californianus TaxID=6549 RepID=UPI002245AF2B|nr:KAT8 regulatory NSL complex subunit 1-like isoform X1 [Mytilus californianus]
MSVPLSLRVCCMAVMAPALTEAATQSCIKISQSSPPVSPELHVPSIAGIANGKNNQPHRAKPLSGLTSHVTIGELKKLQQQGLFKSIGCQEIKFKFEDSDNTVTTKESLPKPFLNGNHSLIDCENMNQTNHVNGNEDIETKLKSDNGPKLDSTVKSVDSKIPVSEENIFANSEHKNKTIDKMVASSSEVDAVSTTEVSNMDMDTDIQSPIDSNLKEEVKKKQHTLERRTQHLLRRLRRLQSRGVESHLHSQLRNFVGFQHKNLQTVAKSIKSSTSNNLNEIKTELFNSDDVKSLSTAALVNLVRRLQSSQSSLSLSQRYLNSKSDSGPTGVLTIDKLTAEESIRVSGLLSNSIHHAQSCCDSDVTESSSGGESCDEDDPTCKKSKSTLLHRRAEWKWASERANVASRWTWLQAQVSDLEYRIRQQSEIYKQIRHTKGPVLLGEQPSPEDLLWRIRQNRAGQKLSPLEQKIANLERKNEALASPCNISNLMMNVNRQASKLTQSLGTVSPAQSTSVMAGDTKLTPTSQAKHLNGVIGTSHRDGQNVTIGPGGDGDVTPHSSPINHDITCQASRCRPVRSYRKRKLLRTAGLHNVSRKAARLSTVKCQCYPPISSCPMCGGRYNNVQRIDVDSFPLQDRVAILDPAFHPVLSFNQEIPLSIRFESHLKKGDWQNASSSKSAKMLSSEKRHQRYLAAKDKARKTGTKYAKGAAAALLSSAKLRNKYERRTPTKPRSTPTKKSDRRLYRSELKKRRAAQLAAKKNRSVSLHGDEYRAMTPSPMSTDSDFGLLSSSYPSCSKDSAQRKKKLENAYDINNIVIPYSMAASTRVEKLQYKEIVTPKWRKLEPEETCDKVANCDYQSEDTSDESFLSRHHTCEVSERKRLSNFVQYPSRRSRSSRTDSGTTEVSQDSSDIYGKDETFRRRSGSATIRRISNSVSFDDGEFVIPMDICFVEPWMERTFPLSEEEYTKMLTDQPPVVESRRRRSSSRVSLSESFGGKPEEEAAEGEAITCSPLPSSSSGSTASEDPNDPEWSAADTNGTKVSKR